jgi:hypothetical protein
MIPNSFSFHEAHGKHRSPEEINALDRQNRTAEARSFHYGDPVNSKDGHKPDRWSGKVQTENLPEQQYHRPPLLVRLFTFLISFF